MPEEPFILCNYSRRYTILLLHGCDLSESLNEPKGGEHMTKIIVVPHYEGTEDFKTLMKRVLSYEISNQYKNKD